MPEGLDQAVAHRSRQRAMAIAFVASWTAIAPACASRPSPVRAQIVSVSSAPPLVVASSRHDPPRLPTPDEQFPRLVQHVLRDRMGIDVDRAERPGAALLPHHSLTVSFTLDARGAVIAARMLRASGVTAFDESVLHIVSTLRLGPVPRRLLTPDGTADVTIDVFDGAARGVLLPRIAISQPDADESVGLRLAAPEPGGLTVTNTTPHDLELSTGLIIWRFVGGTDPGWWLPWHRAELVATCEPAQPPRCVTIRPGESLTIVPWRFMACGGQCLHATMCRSNEYYPQGQFRFTVRACDESWEVESPPFEPPIRRRGE